MPQVRWQGTEYSVGGLVGDNGGTITSSYATGTVMGTNVCRRLGGVSMTGGITSSYATGTVMGTNVCRRLGGELF